MEEGHTPAALSMQLAADAVSVTPGTEGGCDVWVRNGSNDPVQVSLDLYESAAEWSSVEPASVQLAPGGQARAHIRILPPPAGGSAVEGPYRLGVRATPDGDATAAVAAEAVVAVAGVVDFSLDVEPPTSKAYRVAAHDVAVTNGGNAPVSVTLSASEQGDDLAFEFDGDRLDVAPAERARTTLTVNVRRPRRIGRAFEREFAVDAVAAGGTTRHATGRVKVTPSVPRSLVLVSALVLVLGLTAVGFATIGDDDDSPYSCKPLPVPQGSAIRPAHFDGDDDSIAVYTENGVVYLAALVDDTRGARIAPTGLGESTTPIGGADVDRDGTDEGWIVRGPVIFPEFGEVLGMLTFRPPCELTLVQAPVGLRSASTKYSVECRDESGADLVVTAPSGSKLYTLEGSQLVSAGGNPSPAKAGFNCGGLSRPWK